MPQTGQLNNSGPGSLREAIIAANSSSSTQVFQFTHGGELQLTNALPFLTGKLSISAAIGTSVIRAPDRTNIFTVASNAVLHLQGVILTGGEAIEGGAIKNEGTLHLFNCTFLSNSALGAPRNPPPMRVTGGGAVWNSGYLSIQRSVFNSNMATGTSTNGGAIFSTNGTLYIQDSTFTNNTVKPEPFIPGIFDSNIPGSGGDSYGGAIALYDGQLTVVSSTFANNLCRALPGQDGFNSGGIVLSAQTGGSAAGGALFAQGGSLWLTNCTFSGNQALASNGGYDAEDYVFGMYIPPRPRPGGAARAGALCAEGESLQVVNCTFVSNIVFSPTGPTGGRAEHSALVVSSSATFVNNLFSGNSGHHLDYPSSLAAQHNLIVPVSEIRSLANNGGYTPTHSLDWNSAAINAAYPANSPATDQRGIPRPLGGAADIGAVEIEPVKPILIDYSPDQTVYLGTNLILVANFSGTVPITVTWYKGASVISSGPSQSLQLSGITPDHAGEYWARATNSEGETVTPNISVRVDTSSLALINGPQFFSEGEPVILQSQIFAATPYGMQWYFNGRPIGQAGTTKLSIPSAGARHEGEFTVAISNALGEYRSPPFSLRLWPDILVSNLANAGPGSLRHAVETLSATPEAKYRVIRITTPGVIRLTNSLPIITNSVRIVGAGPQHSEINGMGNVQLLTFGPSSVSSVQNLRLSQGRTPLNEGGAAINNLGFISISNCWFRLNSSTGGFGGAIYTSNNLTLRNSYFEQNTAFGLAGHFRGGGGGFGGALFVAGGTASVVNCTFHQNVAQGGGYHPRFTTRPTTRTPPAGFGEGGWEGTSENREFFLVAVSPGERGGFGGGGGGGAPGISGDGYGLPGGSGGFAGGAGELPTFGGTLQPGFGGGGGGIGGAIFAREGSVSIINCTILRNRAAGGYIGGAATPGIGVAGGLYNYAATVSLQNTVISFNIADTDTDLAGSIRSKGFNFLGSSSDSFSLHQTDLVSFDPMLAAVPNTAGDLPCFFPLPGSPLIDRGRSQVHYDQRGQTRPLGVTTASTYPGGDLSDIGAVELDLLHRIVSLRHLPDQTRLTFNTIANRKYTVLYRSDLLSPWQFIPDSFLGSGHWLTVTNLPSASTRGFFQLAVE